ncbi:MAG: hypothetical protein AVDCRST_MAG49-2107, partial [uncultured Thermomicrobiales bacterium]
GVGGRGSGSPGASRRVRGSGTKPTEGRLGPAVLEPRRPPGARRRPPPAAAAWASPEGSSRTGEFVPEPSAGPGEGRRLRVPPPATPAAGV